MPVTQTKPQDGALPLRVGVLVPAGALSAQAVRLLAGLLAEPGLAIRLLAAPQADTEPLSWLARAILAVERRFLPHPRRLALPAIPALPVGTGNLDLAIDLGGGAVDAALSGLPHGLWRIAAAPVQAALVGAPLTEALLIRHAPEGARIIARAVYDTKPLASHNAAYVAEKVAQMILREVKRLAIGASPDLGPVTPGVQRAAGVTRYITRTAGKTLTRLRKALALRRGRIVQGFSLRIGQGSASSFDPVATHPVPMPPNSLWADPFLIAHDGAVWCFFEDYDPIAGRGHISAGRVTDTGLADVQPALKQPHHMSFPLVFAHDGAVYMMPEVHGAGRLEIWRCTDFPGGWELHATAFAGTSVVDSVLLNRDGDWWLFTHISNDSFDDYCSDLHVFRVDGPGLSGLVPHRLNPVVTSSATARGGGRVHIDGTRLLRFSQDNSGGSYGHGLNVMEITRLDLDHYEERRLRHISPDFLPGLIGCHHFDAVDGVFVIDVRKA